MSAATCALNQGQGSLRSVIGSRARRVTGSPIVRSDRRHVIRRGRRTDRPDLHVVGSAQLSRVAEDIVEDQGLLSSPGEPECDRRRQFAAIGRSRPGGSASSLRSERASAMRVEHAGSNGCASGRASPAAARRLLRGLRLGGDGTGRAERGSLWNGTAPRGRGCASVNAVVDRRAWTCHPAPAGVPLPIATRTCCFRRGCHAEISGHLHRGRPVRG
jgi:hypothetical protein